MNFFGFSVIMLILLGSKPMISIYGYQVEKLIKELPSVPADWSNGDMSTSEKNHLSNGISLQQSENESNVRETQSMLLERIASEMNRLKFYMAHAKVSMLSSLCLVLALCGGHI